jgi:hypothetical protein
MAKDKPKKISVKKERYLKFRKDKPGTMNFTPPELSDQQVQERRNDEQFINQFWRSYRRPPERFVNERKAKSKR